MASCRGLHRRLIDIFLVFVAVCAIAKADDVLYITQAPSYLQFKTADAIKLTDIPNLQLATYGLSPEKDFLWNGLTQKGIFNKPKANVLFSVHGLKNNALDIANIAKYSVHQNDLLDTSVVSDRLQRLISKALVVDFSEHNSVFDMKALHPDLFGSLPSSPEAVRDRISSGKSSLSNLNVRSLNVSQNSELTLLAELELIQEMVDALEHSDLAKDVSPDMFHFKLGGIQELIRSGASMEKVADALHLLEEFIALMTEKFQSLYNNNVVIQVVSLDSDFTPSDGLRLRTLKAADEPVPLEKKIGVSQDYQGNYAAMFNIILWTMIVLAVTIFVISYAMWNMDPGRDSIIYRMTSQRIKKD